MKKMRPNTVGVNCEGVEVNAYSNGERVKETNRSVKRPQRPQTHLHTRPFPSLSYLENRVNK